MDLFQNNLRYLVAAAEMVSPPASEWATPNRILLDLDTMRVRDFSGPGQSSAQTPVLIDAPYAGHSSTIADYTRGQSLVETLQSHGLTQVLVTDWKSATASMKDFGIDKYLSDIDIAVDSLGGKVNLVGLCQGAG